MAPLAQDPRHRQADLSIPTFFARLKDPRRAHRRLHLLQDVIVIALGAAIAGAQDRQKIEAFGRRRKDWLRRLLELPNGTPPHDTFERVFDRLKPQAFPACFRDGVQAVSEALRIKHVAIDGKALRGSGSAKLGPLHLVSARAAAQRLSPGQVAVDAKSNEITAIPALLELRGVKGALVTIDAMGCKKDTAANAWKRPGSGTSARSPRACAPGRGAPSSRSRGVGPAAVRGRSRASGPISRPRRRWSRWRRPCPRAWQRLAFREGTKGTQQAEFARLRVIAERGDLPGPELWLVVERGLDQESKVKYYLSNAAPEVPPLTLVQVGQTRWPVEDCFLQGKQEVRLDAYEVRSWLGWHHHMTPVMLALWFLKLEAQRLGEKSGRRHHVA